MEPIYLEALSSHLIPPLADIVIEYLTLKYTFAVENAKWMDYRTEYGNDNKANAFMIVCWVTPMKGTIACRVSTVIMDHQKDSLSKHPEWDFDRMIFPELPDEIQWRVSKELRCEIGLFSSALEALVSELVSKWIDLRLVFNLFTNDGFHEAVYSERYIDLQDTFVNLATLFAGLVRNLPTDYDGKALVNIIQREITPDTRPIGLANFLELDD